VRLLGRSSENKPIKRASLKDTGNKHEKNSRYLYFSKNWNQLIAGPFWNH